MTGYLGCRNYQGTKSPEGGLWMACLHCAHPYEAHSPEARLISAPQAEPQPLSLEDTILVVLKRHRINWVPGQWTCSCGKGAWTTELHWNQHHASLIAEAVQQLGLIPTGANTWSAPAPLSDPDANRAGIAGARSTSAAAALRVQPKTGTQRRRILDYITTHGPSTDDEIGRDTGLGPNSHRARRVELVEGGWLEEIDKQGTTDKGLPAIRWGLTSQARARLQGAA